MSLHLDQRRRFAIGGRYTDREEKGGCKFNECVNPDTSKCSVSQIGYRQPLLPVQQVMMLAISLVPHLYQYHLLSHVKTSELKRPA